jgi:hypothetical protein
MSTYTMKDLSTVYAAYCGSAIAVCRLTREIVGGQPATDDGIRAFAKHHLHIPDEEIEEVVARIKGEEIGERDTTPATGELKEKESYGLNVLRHSAFGPWVGDWQIKAALKQAASRVGLFVAKRGTKGDIAEMGKISAHGISLHGPEFQIHLIAAESETAAETDHIEFHGRTPSPNKPAETEYQKFLGRVNTPSGAKSIVNDAECCPAGSRFSFCFQWYDAKLTEADIVSVFAALPIIGLGSAKSLERGKFDIETLDIEMAEAKRARFTEASDSSRAPGKGRIGLFSSCGCGGTERHFS